MLEQYFYPADELLYGQIIETNTPELPWESPQFCFNMLIDTQVRKYFEL